MRDVAVVGVGFPLLQDGRVLVAGLHQDGLEALAVLLEVDARGLGLRQLRSRVPQDLDRGLRIDWFGHHAALSASAAAFAAASARRSGWFALIALRSLLFCLSRPHT